MKNWSWRSAEMSEALAYWSLSVVEVWSLWLVSEVELSEVEVWGLPSCLELFNFTTLKHYNFKI